MRARYGAHARRMATGAMRADCGPVGGSDANLKTRRGRQKRSSTASAIIEASDAIRSGRYGPRKVAVAHWHPAKERPQTATAGSAPSAPRHPDMMSTRYRGRITEMKGSWWPTIAESRMRPASPRPITPPIATMGIPIVPNATGAVLATRQRPAAYSGSKPRPTSVAPAMATGAPKPAAPSMKAPKQKAISRAWILRSGVRPAIEARICSNCPPATVRL